MSNEGNLWKVRWKKIGRSYRVFVEADPKVQATAHDLEDAIDQLEERITDELGDAVPHLEWVNPLPHPVGIEGRDFVYVLCGHHSIEVANLEMLFAGPQCTRCQNYTGPRSPEPIHLNGLPDGDLPFTDFLGQLCSSRLAQCLHLNECQEFRMLPTVIAGKETAEFLELRANVAREYVAKKDTPSRWAYRCPECGRTTIPYMPYEADYFQYIAASSLPHPLPSVFAIGSDYSVRLGITNSLRKQIIGSDGFKNVITRKVGILTDDLAVPADLFFKSLNTTTEP